MSKKSVTIRAAIITGVFILLAAILTPIVTRLFSRHKDTTTITTGNQENSPFFNMGEKGEVNIHYNIPETATKDTIKLLEEKLKDVNSVIQLNREEIRSLAVALKDLDQRTSGIEKLPDGRTKFGGYLAGQPTIVLEEHNASIKYYNELNFQDAFEYSQKAINAFEESAKITEGQSTIQMGGISGENVAKLYNQGFLTALKVERKDLAYKWVQIAIDKYETIEKKIFLASQLANSGEIKKAMDIVQELMQKYPDNPLLIELNQKLTSFLK